MAGEVSPSSRNTPTNTEAVSKVILRIETFKGIAANQNTVISRLNEVSRTLHPQLHNRIAIAAAGERATLVEVTGAENLYGALSLAAEATDAKIQEAMLPVEVVAARMALSTYDVSPSSAWNNLLKAENDVTEVAQGVIEQARSKAWDDSFSEVFTLSQEEGK